MSGRISTLLNLNDVAAEHVLLTSEHINLGPRSQLLARNANIDVLTIAENGLTADSEGNPTVAIDLDGATIGLIKPYVPVMDDGFVDTSVGSVTGEAPDEAGYRRFYLQTMTQALARPLRYRNGDEFLEVPRGYNAFAFQQLRLSAATMGFPNVARDIAIQQNVTYQEHLGGDQILLKVVYFLGGLINRYGYDNSWAVLYLFVLWLIGLGVLHSEGLRDWASEAYTGRKPARPAAKQEGKPTSRFRPAFFSMDRTIPTLALDQAFASFADLPPWKANVLYLQRVLASVIILIMIGGAFSFYQ
jgi:hypothetical protein